MNVIKPDRPTEGMPTAILVALLTQVVTQGYTLLRNAASSTALSHMAFTVLLVLIGDTLYLRLAGSFLSLDIPGRLTPLILLSQKKEG